MELTSVWGREQKHFWGNRLITRRKEKPESTVSLSLSLSLSLHAVPFRSAARANFGIRDNDEEKGTFETFMMSRPMGKVEEEEGKERRGDERTGVRSPYTVGPANRGGLGERGGKGRG